MHLNSNPDLFQPYGGFPGGGGVAVDNSHILLPELPDIGFGFEGKADLYRAMVKLVQ